MELIACDVDAFHLGLADLDALLVAARIECALDFQAGLGRRRADQLDQVVTSGWKTMGRFYGVSTA